VGKINFLFPFKMGEERRNVNIDRSIGIGKCVSVGVRMYHLNDFGSEQKRKFISSRGGVDMRWVFGGI
jgi:hypothetical protein